MRLRPTLAFTLALVANLGLSTAVAAQDRETSIEQARRLMEQGQTYYLQGRFGEAAAEFEAAYQAEPFSAFLFNAGVAYENARDSRRAVEFFRLYLERDPSASDRAPVEQRIERLSAAIAAAEAAARPPEPQTTEGTGEGEGGTGESGTGTGTGEGTTDAGPDAVDAAITPVGPPPDALPADFKSLVSVRTDPDGATVTISRGSDSVATGPSPFSATLDQGRYHVRIEHPDFNVTEQDIQVDPGKVYVVIVNLSQGEFLGYVRVVTDVPGASVFIDDHDAGARGQTPWEGPLAVGDHHIWVERPGYEPIETDTSIGIGDEVELRLELGRVSYGRVRVIGNIRGARVYVDGHEVGVVPWEGRVEAGSHRVRVTADGMKDFEQALEIQRGQLSPVRVRLRPDVGRGGAWVTATFGVLMIGGGITAGLFSNDFYAQLEADRAAGRLATSDERLDLAFGLAVGADVAFGLAVVLGGLSLYYFLVDPLPPSEGTALEPRDWSFAPMLDPSRGVAGGGMQWSF